MKAASARTRYRVTTESVEACHCQHGCNCHFGGYPNEGTCEFIIGYEVRSGRVGDLSLTGLRAVIAAQYPNAIHEGNGHAVGGPRSDNYQVRGSSQKTCGKGRFFWNEARIATTSTMRAQHDELRLEWPGKYAAATEVNWTNE